MKKGNIMGYRQTAKTVLGILLCLMLTMGLLISAQAAVTTADSGPAVGKHTAQHYIMDCATKVITNGATGEQVTTDGVNGLPFLYPGDTVEFRPSQNNDSFVFFDPSGNWTVADKPGADGNVHVHVLSTTSFYREDGAGNRIEDVVVMTKVEIVGDELVQLNAGTYSEVFGRNHERQSVSQLKFRYVPMWCDIHTELWFEVNADKHQMTGAEAASAASYTSEQSSTRAWAEDSLANGYGATGKEVLLTLRRPYIEGRYFTGIKFDSMSGNNRISKEYSVTEGDGWHGNYWEGWMDNQIEIHPSLKKTGNSDYSGSGSYDDELLVRFKYSYGRTVTFDACGGTIDGYPSRIYEAMGRQYFNQDLQSGKVDKDFAAGKAYVPVRQGYTFGGWYEDADYKTPVTSIKDTVNKYDDSTDHADVKRVCRLYAKWLQSANLKDCKLKAIPNQTYTGKSIEPRLTLTYRGDALEKGKDYTVAWKNNKKIGTATVTITGKGRFSGKKTASFQIVPRGIALSSLKAGSKELTVSWKKGKDVDGYEIEYSLKKDFKGAKKVTITKAATTKTTLTKLQGGKTYYVRIRAFKKVSGKTYTSDWSKAKSKKTLK